MDMKLLETRIGVPMTELESFCKRWNIGKLWFFGSVLRDDFGPNSDIDLMVTFDSKPTPGLFGLVTMESELKDLTGRDVDIVTRRAVENSRNYIRRKAVLDSALLVYEA